METRKLMAGLAVIAAMVMVLGGAGWASPILGDFTFGQADWYDVSPNSGTLLQQNSSWGRLDFNVSGDATSTYYLNVVGSKNSSYPWIVQNLPLFSQAVDPGTVGVSVDINLRDFGLTEGTALGQFSYGYTLETAPLSSVPLVSSWTAKTTTTLMYRALTEDGVLVDRGPSFGAPVGIKAAGAASVAKNIVEHKGVPRVKEDDSQCMTGAFARSLSWLNTNYKLGSDKSAQDMYGELKGQIGTEKGLKTEERIKKKAEYAKGISGNIVTKVLDVRGVLDPITGVSEDSTSKLIDWLKKELKTEDVELAYLIYGNGTDKKPTGGHIVTVTGMYEQDGTQYLKFRDDESQLGSGNDNTGDTKEKRARLGITDGKDWFRNDKRLVTFAVSESVVPEPSTMILFTLGVVGLGFYVRRRR